MFIDVHTHVYPDKIAHKVLAMLEGHYAIPPVGSGTVDDLLRRLERAGLDRAVVHTAATAPSQVIPANNWAVELNQDYPELVAFGSVHPDFAHNDRELDRLAAAGVPGVKFHHDFQGFRMDDPAFLSLLEMIEGRFVCMFHVGDRPPPEENPSCPAKMAAILRQFPNLTAIAAHLGGYLHWQWALESLIGQEVYIDTSSSLAFIDDATLKAIFDRHPREFILFGSDYPLFDASDEIKLLRSRLKLRDADLEQLLSNAARLFPA